MDTELSEHADTAKQPTGTQKATSRSEALIKGVETLTSAVQQDLARGRMVLNQAIAELLNRFSDLTAQVQRQKSTLEHLTRSLSGQPSATNGVTANQPASVGTSAVTDLVTNGDDSATNASDTESHRGDEPMANRTDDRDAHITGALTGMLEQFVQEIVRVSRDSMLMVEQADVLADQIGKIVQRVNGIDRISKQSHMLALNARIETHRAGAAGRDIWRGCQ